MNWTDEKIIGAREQRYCRHYVSECHRCRRLCFAQISRSKVTLRHIISLLSGTRISGVYSVGEYIDGHEKVFHITGQGGDVRLVSSNKSVGL